MSAVLPRARTRIASIAQALLLLALLGPGADIAAQQPTDSTVYRALFLRAAPGRLLELIDLYQRRMVVHDATGEPRPLFARHSQGDHWDLLLLYPVGSLPAWYDPARYERWTRVADQVGLPEPEFITRDEELVAWREELFVTGPPVATLRDRNADAGFYHLEVFLALAGQREGLLRQRKMENDYLRRIGREENLIFTRLGGASWDLFTLGFYRNLQHYAEPTRVSAEDDDAAARAAGFEGRNTIGSYLRTFLAGHHDTLLNRVR